MVSTWVKLHRKIADNPVMRHPVALQVLIWCMVKVQRKPYRHATRWGAVDLKPGEVMATRRHLAEALEGTERQMRTALALLSQEKIISIKTTNTFSVITLTNWADLQTGEEETTSTRPALDQHSTQEQEREKERKKKEPNTLTPSAAAPESGFNFFGHLCEALDKAGAVITERSPITIGRISAKGKKVGESVFKGTVERYCKDEYCLKAGLSLNGFINSFDRLATKAKGQDYFDGQRKAESEAKVAKMKF